MLKIAFSITQLSYNLRVSPAYQHVADLEAFNSILGDASSAATNVQMDDHFWKQASLPVGLGGLEVRRTLDVALAAFLALLHSVRDLVDLSGINMAESGDLAAAEKSYVGRWPSLAAPY